MFDETPKPQRSYLYEIAYDGINKTFGTNFFHQVSTIHLAFS